MLLIQDHFAFFELTTVVWQGVVDIFMVEYSEKFLTNMAVKEFWKSVHICQSYDKKSSVLFFWDTVYNCIYTFIRQMTAIKEC